MRTAIFTTAVLLLAGAAQAQTPSTQTSGPTPPTSDLTRDLNSGPPTPAVYLAPAPIAEPVSAVPAPAGTVSAPPTPVASPPRTDPIPAAPAIQPRPTPDTGPAPVTPARTEPPASAPEASVPATPPPAAAPEASVPAAPPPAAAPALSVLDSADRAALPFTVVLPPGFEIVAGRPGPDFQIYTIRRGDRSFVMVYTGPASQFPIYSGQMVEAGGRASVVATENGVRYAKEHLFQRSSAPNEIHIWTMSLDGADRIMAEQIAQTVDVR